MNADWDFMIKPNFIEVLTKLKLYKDPNYDLNIIFASAFVKPDKLYIAPNALKFFAGTSIGAYTRTKKK